MSSFTKQLVGPRSKTRSQVSDILAIADDAMNAFGNGVPENTSSIRDLKVHFSIACRAYYAMAAASRRKNLDDSDRENLLSSLFLYRSRIESAIISAAPSARDVWEFAYTPSFFGVSKKQGVSLRYPLVSCVPTTMCGGRCYAHDGRDRELHLVFRAVLNYLIGTKYENSNSSGKEHVMNRLEPFVDRAIRLSLEDQHLAEASGYIRAPRIRFSHIGEVADTPNFANALAKMIKEKNPNIQCVAYTRHPNACLFDPDYITVNFTLESANDSRARFVPEGARVVGSAWDGQLVKGAQISFVEHHVEKAASLSGDGIACPVAINHKDTPTCDSAKCSMCFQPTRSL